MASSPPVVAAAPPASTSDNPVAPSTGAAFLATFRLDVSFARGIGYSSMSLWPASSWPAQARACRARLPAVLRPPCIGKKRPANRPLGYRLTKPARIHQEGALRAATREPARRRSCSRVCGGRRAAQCLAAAYPRRRVRNGAFTGAPARSYAVTCAILLPRSPLSNDATAARAAGAPSKRARRREGAP